MLLIQTDGTVSRIAPDDVTLPVAELLDVDSVDVIRADGWDMWCDDEGLINGSEPNPVATLLLVAMQVGHLGQAIHGDVLLASVDAAGRTIPLPDEVRQVLTSKLKAIQHYAVDHGMLGT